MTTTNPGNRLLIIGGIVGVVLLGVDVAIYEWAAFHDFGETAEGYARGLALAGLMITLAVLGGMALVTALVGGVMTLRTRRKAA